LVREVIDRALMDLTGKYHSLKDFAQRLEDRLKFEGLKGLSVGIDDKEAVVAVLYEGRPLVSIFLSVVPNDKEGKYQYCHEEFWIEPNPVIWDREVLRELQLKMNR